MKKIEAKIVADSISPKGNRITTFLLTYPRFIHSELMTHRMFSRNSASSRAIPFEKMVKMVEEDPFIPIAWQKDHKGMQGTEYWNDEDIYPILGNSYSISAKVHFRNEWLAARDYAILSANHMSAMKLTKQLCNRLLEPFMWHTVLVTATEYDNFFDLRCSHYVVNWYPSRRPEALEPTQASFKSRKDAIKYTEGECSDWTEQDWRECNESQAEIHIQALAEAMWDAMNESTPKELKAGEWHIPFLDASYYKDDKSPLLPFLYKTNAKPDTLLNYSIKIATARCARLSYMTFDNEINYEKDIKLHDQLLESKHFSPFEHCARVMDDVEFESYHKGQFVPESDSIAEDIGMAISNDAFGWCNNFKGFIPYRYLIENKK